MKGEVRTSIRWTRVPSFQLPLSCFEWPLSVRQPFHLKIQPMGLVGIPVHSMRWVRRCVADQTRGGFAYVSTEYVKHWAGGDSNKATKNNNWTEAEMCRHVQTHTHAHTQPEITRRINASVRKSGSSNSSSNDIVGCQSRLVHVPTFIVIHSWLSGQLNRQFNM